MGLKIKLAIMIFPLVIGSYFVPGSWPGNSKFPEYREIGKTIKNYSTSICKERKTVQNIPTPSTAGIGVHIYQPAIMNDETFYTEQEYIYDKRTTRHSVNTGCKQNRFIVYDVNGNMATARLTTHWGIQYLHLIKVNGNWTIYNVL